MTEADLGFQRYLRDHGYAGADDHEPDLGICRRPDFKITKNGASAVCEVKQFDSPSPLDRRIHINPVTGRAQPISASGKEVYGPIRTQVHEAARQLRELDGSGIPLVVVLANPQGRWVNLDVPHTIYALYGDPMVGGAYNPEAGTIEQLGPRRGFNGEITNDHQYVTAVVLLHRRTHEQNAVRAWLDEHRERLAAEYPDLDERCVAMMRGLDALQPPDGDYYRLDVIHTTAARLGRAPLLDPNIFDGPHDRQWVANPDGTYSEAVHQPN